MAMNLLLALVIGLATVAPQAGQDARQSLAGISNIRVIVEDLTNEALEDGISRDLLKTDAELKLRLAGIKVDAESSISPYVYVQVTYRTTKPTQGWPRGYFFVVRISFEQMATLRSNLRMVVPTWNISMLAAGPSGNGPNHVRQVVHDLVDAFLSDYLSLNPKR